MYCKWSFIKFINVYVKILVWPTLIFCTNGTNAPHYPPLLNEGADVRIPDWKNKLLYNPFYVKHSINCRRFTTLKEIQVSLLKT